MATELAEEIRRALPVYGTAPEPERIARLAAYLSELQRWNRRVRLVGSASPHELARRHLGESLFLATLLPLQSQTLIDVGSGGGFPGLALQIAFPALKTTLVESNSRKAAFLQEITRASGLGRVVVQRAEVVDEQVEIVTVRALERMELGPERFAHLLIPGGKLAVWISVALAERWIGQYPGWKWTQLAAIPGSRERAILLGEHV